MSGAGFTILDVTGIFWNKGLQAGRQSPTESVFQKVIDRKV